MISSLKKCASIEGQSNQPIFTNQEQPRFHSSTLGDVALLGSMYFSQILWCFKVGFSTAFVLWAFIWTAVCQRGSLAVWCFLVGGSHVEWCLKQLYVKISGNWQNLLQLLLFWSSCTKMLSLKAIYSRLQKCNTALSQVFVHQEKCAVIFWYGEKDRMKDA